MSSRFHGYFSIALLVAMFSVGVAQAVEVRHLYNLSDFTGTVPFSWVNFAVDPQHDEVFVAGGLDVQVFNGAGMATYRFAKDVELGRILDLTVDEDGDILILSESQGTTADRDIFVARCDYRGQLDTRIDISGVPAEFASIRPDHLRYRDGRLYVISYTQLLVVITDSDGVFQTGYDLAPILGISEQDRLSTEMGGFNLDKAGNFLVTIPVAFRAFVIQPGGEVQAFGRGGSVPGAFGVVAGIATTDDGKYLVADGQRNVVIVFDEAFRFITEFGHRGLRPKNLIRPNRVEVGSSGRIYVTQLRDRGVAVFSVSTN